ncbi:GGDEF domain-containing protein [Pseudomonas sp. 5P_3.1_Bac2]|uniref:GGDEF domain-containing protein n=1 Tax=Pseudomonas sp. 5P_3.1_Bac2 TaxID=2971617 RepID=UPI0021C8A060|nr:GGDEF domain-containing protein [Pseudomonas sp. 5P_3.1_Bac2]MCU1719371.1 GGDEF domain-containing protein [Pseudomonas sp. 5P_3.1_Bac2]
MHNSRVPSLPGVFVLWREAQDTYSRSALGGVYFLLAWPLTWFFSSDPQALLLPGLIGVLVLLLLLYLRINHPVPRDHNEAKLQRWLVRHWCLMHATALCWGLLNALALRHESFSESEIIALMGTIAFGTAIVFNFSMRKQQAYVALLLIFTPGLLVLLFDWREQYPLLISLLLYLTYLSLALKFSHRAYQRNLNMELQLLSQQDKLDRLSRTDSLTQLGNRYQFNSLFPVLLSNAYRQQQPLSLVLVDIDFFKQINDAHGHACGDACLTAFAERMRQYFRRASDILLRVGGEEFAVLMPNTTLEQARLLADQFRHKLAQEHFAVSGLHLVLTASVGVGSYSASADDNPEMFFKRVDDALYRAKHSGRNCLHVAELPEPPAAQRMDLTG